MHTNICTHHRLRSNDGNKAPPFWGYTWNNQENYMAQPPQTYNNGKYYNNGKSCTYILPEPYIMPFRINGYEILPGVTCLFTWNELGCDRTTEPVTLKASLEKLGSRCGEHSSHTRVIDIVAFLVLGYSIFIFIIVCEKSDMCALSWWQFTIVFYVSDNFVIL